MIHISDGKSPYELFSLFFDDGIVSLIAEQTNLYASQKNADFEVFEYEIRRFIGIWFLSGYHTLPQIRYYWSKEPDFGDEIVKQALTRNRFDTIKSFIHLADNNNLDKTDGFAKVRQFIESANHRFMQFGIFSHDLSIDEEMIPYYGRHSSKMFIKGKFIHCFVIETLHRLYNIYISSIIIHSMQKNLCVLVSKAFAWLQQLDTFTKSLCTAVHQLWLRCFSRFVIVRECLNTIRTSSLFRQIFYIVPSHVSFE